MSSVLTIRHYLTLDPPDAVATTALQANIFGDVIGNYSTASGATDSYLYAAGQYTMLDGTAVAINPQGEVVGDSTDNKMFIYNNGSYTTVAYPVDHLAISQDFASGINDIGRVVGEYTDPGNRHAQELNGFVERDSTYETVDVPGATFTKLTGINDADMIAGYFGTSSGTTEGFVATSEFLISPNITFTTFAPPGSTDFETVAINQQGEVIGESLAAPGSQAADQGFLYNAGSLTAIAVPNALSTRVQSLNDDGIVTGIYRGATGTQGFIDNDGSYTRVSIPNAQSMTFLSISNQIGTSGDYYLTGNYTDAQDVEHAFRATVALSSPSSGNVTSQDILAGAQLTAADLLPIPPSAAAVAPSVSSTPSAYVQVLATQTAPIIGGAGAVDR